MNGFLAAAWAVLMELAPWLLLGTAVASLLHLLIPARVVQRQLSGPWGVFKAVALGVPLPLCSCGVIPAGVGLKRNGASDGAAIGFLISTPQTGVDSILVSASMLGWPFALFKVGSALVTGLVGGQLSDWVSDSNGPAVDGAADHDDAPRTPLGAARHGLQILRSIGAGLSSGW